MIKKEEEEKGHEEDKRFFCPHLVWDVLVLIQKHLELADTDV